MKKYIWPIVGLVSAVIVIGFVGWALTRPDAQHSASLSTTGDVVSENGLHWHPQLTIYINGEKITIPKDIGISSAGHKSPHTHDEKGELHWENQGKVTKNDLKLGKVFENWGKKFSKTQLLDKVDPSGSKITMTVNGQSTLEFAEHIVADKEQIEIRYQD